ncbi:hypothetical protein TUM20985_12790 [Mycobacterium antarcticum]|uniref:DUF1298 domain-containing protein n=1 Tax=unclassified Mycolicibacterium TaxID=2636767 RepID=UPI0023A75EE9|nr:MULTISPECIES: DUF1298 domain-containing protein [unclassified Mycolicibacterium]BDX30732.1 hypothetical protein TUM20985_12790 [Mycolicibacterium sp. TUM20985]GLP79880.1 hypothetical protein TUM20984_13000 [Mycolicibacterium sp. TUM20984]
MTQERLTPIDAQTFWFADKIPNDTFLMFGFAGGPTDLAQTLGDLEARARGWPDLSVRIDDRGGWGYPSWVRRDADRSQFVVHDLDDRTWAACLDAVCTLIADQVDAGDTAWRLHVFTGIVGVPGVDGSGTVAVFQISHALGGGGRTLALAALMFGRPGVVLPEIHPPSNGPLAMPLAGFRAARAHRRLMADVEAGVVPAQAELRPLQRTNDRPSGPRRLRTVVRRRADLSGATVTVAVLSAVSTALSGRLAALGDDPSALGAEVPMAKAPPHLAYNHFGNVGVGLHPGLPADVRAARIADDLAARRSRAGHPGLRAADVAFAVTPAPLLRWGMDRFDPGVRPAAVTGNTVVSSVNCGAADFSFGGAPVVLATAFAGLSPMMGLTHVVFGVGGTICLGVHAADSALGGPDGMDDYVARLEAALPGTGGRGVGTG